MAQLSFIEQCSLGFLLESLTFDSFSMRRKGNSSLWVPSDGNLDCSAITSSSLGLFCSGGKGEESMPFLIVLMNFNKSIEHGERGRERENYAPKSCFQCHFQLCIQSLIFQLTALQWSWCKASSPWFNELASPAWCSWAQFLNCSFSQLLTFGDLTRLGECFQCFLQQ